jgi:Zn finger protein HypA/HybF involved in hydrogenase expression
MGLQKSHQQAFVGTRTLGRVWSAILTQPYAPEQSLLQRPSQAASDKLSIARSAHPMTCKHCKTPMKELKGHIYHKKRKWQCPACARIRMQKHR